MKTTSAVLKIVLLTSMICSAHVCLAQAAARPFPVSPMAGMGAFSVRIGPSDSVGAPTEVRGQTKISCHVPLGKKPTTIDVSLDGKSMGAATKKGFLFTMDFDTTKIAEGEHTLKATGLDEAGKEIWNASRKVIVANSKPASAGQPNMPMHMPVSVPGANVAPAATQPSPHRPPIAQFIPAPKKSESSKPAHSDVHNSPTRVVAADPSLSSVLKSDRFGFSIHYPAKWISIDETSKMNRVIRGRWWVVLGTKPIKTAHITVNVRRRQLDPGSNAENFAKCENYVQNWDKKTVLGAPAYSTVSGSPASKRVIHRLIVIKDGVVWMINCTDTTGQPVQTSAKLFQAMVDTMQIGGSENVLPVAPAAMVAPAPVMHDVSSVQPVPAAAPDPVVTPAPTAASTSVTPVPADDGNPYDGDSN